MTTLSPVGWAMLFCPPLLSQMVGKQKDACPPYRTEVLADVFITCD